MDVICERCKAEYEFDEALLGEKGTTVKCSACGHVFRVLPPHRDLARSHLKLRAAADGSIRALSSLRELQQRIRAGEVSLDDELGRDGFPFRALREVPELKNFFAPKATPSKTPHEKTTVQPNASVLGAESAGKTVEGRVPGSTPGATMSGQPAPRANTTRPPLPSERAKKAPTEPPPAQPAIEVAPYSELPPEPSSARVETRSSEPTAPPEARARSFTKHTMMGVGPQDLQLPPPPRMPSFGAGDAQRGAQSAAIAQPVRAVSNLPAREPVREPPAAQSEPPPSPHGTLRGRPSSENVPLEPAHNHAAFGRGGTMSPQYAAPAVPEADAEIEPTEAELETESELVEPEDVPPSRASGGFANTDQLVARLQDGAPSVLDVPDSARKLYLEDEERAPGRVEDGSSKLGLSMLLLLVLGGGGYLAWMAVEGPEGEYYSATTNEADDEPEAAAPEVAATSPGAAPADPVPEPVPGATPEDEADSKSAQGPDSAAASAEEPAPSAPLKPEPKVEPVAAKPEPVAPKPEPVAAKPEPKPEPAKAPVAKPADVAKPAPAVAAARPIAANPEDYGGLVTKGDQLDARGDHEGAQRAFRAALATRPAGSEANAGLGFALLATGKARDALPYFDSAASSGYAEANIGLGDAYRKLGQASSAAEAYQAYLDRLPRGARADYARTQIDKLKNGGGEPAPSRNEPYRPAGELIAPSAPAQPNETPP